MIAVGRRFISPTESSNKNPFKLSPANDRCGSHRLRLQFSVLFRFSSFNNIYIDQNASQSTGGCRPAGLGSNQLGGPAPVWGDEQSQRWSSSLQLWLHPGIWVAKSSQHSRADIHSGLFRLSPSDPRCWWAAPCCWCWSRWRAPAAGWPPRSAPGCRGPPRPASHLHNTVQQPVSSHPKFQFERVDIRSAVLFRFPC